MKLGGVASLLIVMVVVAGCGRDTRGSAAPAADGRQASGIPESRNGEPVLIGVAAAVRAAESTDATQFLVGGWFYDATFFTCSGGITPRPLLLSGCATGLGGVAPGNSSEQVGRTRVFWDGHTLPEGRSPAILRVHTHDGRASDCEGAGRAECDAVAVVDDVLWTGDGGTAAGPLTVIAAVDSLGAIGLITSFKTGPMSSLSVQRDLFAIPVETPCPAPWPQHVFAIHGDPQFGLLAVFPDEEARTAAQASLDVTAPGCAIDPRIERAEDATWAAHRNVLALVYGETARGRMQGAFDGTIDRDRYTAFPPEDLNESHRVVNDLETAREAGILSGAPLLPFGAGDTDSVDDLYRRFHANALRYVIGAASQPTEAVVGAKVWHVLEQAAVPGTAVLYDVDHPDSTDQALRPERIVAYRLKEPEVDTWDFLVVPPLTQ